MRVHPKHILLVLSCVYVSWNAEPGRTGIARRITRPTSQTAWRLRSTGANGFRRAANRPGDGSAKFRGAPTRPESWFRIFPPPLRQIVRFQKKNLNTIKSFIQPRWGTGKRSQWYNLDENRQIKSSPALFWRRGHARPEWHGIENFRVLHWHCDGWVNFWPLPHSKNSHVISSGVFILENGRLGAVIRNGSATDFEVMLFGYLAEKT